MLAIVLTYKGRRRHAGFLHLHQDPANGPIDQHVRALACRRSGDRERVHQILVVAEQARIGGLMQGFAQKLAAKAGIEEASAVVDQGGVIAADLGHAAGAQGVLDAVIEHRRLYGIAVRPPLAHLRRVRIRLRSSWHLMSWMWSMASMKRGPQKGASGRRAPACSGARAETRSREGVRGWIAPLVRTVTRSMRSTDSTSGKARPLRMCGV